MEKFGAVHAFFDEVIDGEGLAGTISSIAIEEHNASSGEEDNSQNEIPNNQASGSTTI